MKKLEGKTVKNLMMSPDKCVIAFGLEDGSILYASAMGSCCSHSWFEHVNGISALLGQKVNRIVEREMPEAQTLGHDEIKFYGWTLETNQGRCDFEMRNQSNGYYGGDVVIDSVVRNQYNDEEEKPEFKPLDNDF